jgi:hypothetical protein
LQPKKEILSTCGGLVNNLVTDPSASSRPSLPTIVPPPKLWKLKARWPILVCFWIASARGFQSSIGTGFSAMRRRDHNLAS